MLHKFSVDLPKKHGRGGQSSVRFARLRVEKRHNYMRKVAETATQMFITDDKPNIAGLIMCVARAPLGIWSPGALVLTLRPCAPPTPTPRPQGGLCRV